MPPGGGGRLASVPAGRGTGHRLLLVVDATSVIAFAEGDVVEALGARAEDVVGRTITEVFCGRLAAGVRDALAGRNAHMCVPLPDGDIELGFEPRRAADGRIVGVVVQTVESGHAARMAALRIDAQRLARIGCWEWDPNRDVLHASDELLSLYGIEPGTCSRLEELLARVHDDDRGAVRAAILRARDERAPFCFDHRVTHPSGCLGMVHTRGDVELDAAGAVKRIVASTWDVTSEWQDKLALERSRSLLLATLESTADGILVVDLEGRFSLYNERFVEMWRVPKHLLDARDDEAALACVLDQLEDPDAFMCRVRELYAEPEASSFDVIRFRDGRVLERHSRPQRIGGTVVGRVWTFHDVTQRTRLLNRAAILAEASRLLASLDVERAIGMVARHAVPELASACAFDVIDGDAGPRRLVAVGEDADRLTIPAVVLGGRSVLHAEGDASCLCVPVRSHRGVVGAFVAVSRRGRRWSDDDLEVAEELATRIGLAMENAKLYREAHEILKARDEFLSVAAHELRGPVTSLQLAVQGLQRAKVPAAKALSIVEREACRIARLVDDLLDVTRIRRGRMTFDLEDVDFADVLRDAIAQLGAELTRSGSTLTVTMSGTVEGRWDRMRLQQIATNLLSNAIKFGQGRPIEVTLSSTADSASLVVRDQGMGIPPEMLERIFDPFERTVSARHYGGLGLGLYIVRSIVDAIGGRVAAESQPGAGAVFRVELPRKLP